MSGNLRSMLDERRNRAGLTLRAWGKETNVVFTSLSGFSNGKRTLGLPAIKNLAKWAQAHNDRRLVIALAEYALGVNVDTGCEHNSKISEPGIWVCADCGMRVDTPHHPYPPNVDN